MIFQRKSKTCRHKLVLSTSYLGEIANTRYDRTTIDSDTNIAKCNRRQWRNGVALRGALQRYLVHLVGVPSRRSRSSQCSATTAVFVLCEFRRHRRDFRSKCGTAPRRRRVSIAGGGCRRRSFGVSPVPLRNGSVRTGRI